jgi:hypothetical protein
VPVARPLPVRYSLAALGLLPAYKYQAQLEALPHCPDQGYASRACEAFRFVFEASLATSFLPVLVLNPQRALRFSDREKCGGWALSFFVSVDAARTTFVALKKISPRIHKTIGDAIATGTLTAADGVMCEPDTDGHFELHEFESTNLQDRFALIERLT